MKKIILQEMIFCKYTSPARYFVGERVNRDFTNNALIQHSAFPRETPKTAFGARIEQYYGDDKVLSEVRLAVVMSYEL